MNDNDLDNPVAFHRAVLAIAVGVGLILIAGWIAICLTVGVANAHEAVSLEGKPLGFNWPAICCGDRDCAFIPASAVVETAEGYRVTLKVGQHPMLKTKGYTAIIPYGDEKPSPTGDYAICLSADGAHRFCFFAGGRLG